MICSTKLQTATGTLSIAPYGMFGSDTNRSSSNHFVTVKRFSCRDALFASSSMRSCMVQRCCTSHPSEMPKIGNAFYICMTTGPSPSSFTHSIFYALNMSLKQLLNHVGAIAVVIFRDMAHWQHTYSLPLPDVRWHNRLFHINQG